MPDEADIANEYTERLTAEALAQRQRHVGPSAESCIDCGEPIPKVRRESIQGVQTCVACAEKRERRL